MAWVVYFVAALFPDQIWLGLAPILMGFPAQFVVHGILTTRKLKYFYNPGLGAVVLGHLPLAIWYVIAVYQEDLIRWWDWAIGIVLLGFFMGFVMQVVGFRILAPPWRQLAPVRTGGPSGTANADFVVQGSNPVWWPHRRCP